jgi:D-alanyl-D-alanine carboxypeptidase
MFSNRKATWTATVALSALLYAAATVPEAQAQAQERAGYCTNSRALAAEIASLQAVLGAPSISAAVFSSDGPITAAALGVRNVDTGELVTLDDLYAVGSLTKTVTAVIIGSLVDEGRLDLDATLAELLPDLAPGMSAGFRDVTLGQLLNHTAGLPALDQLEDFEALFQLTGTPAQQREQLATLVLSGDPIFAPGSGELYSNPGVAIAGLIAERAAGLNWESLLQERVGAPLGIDLLSGIPLDAGPDQPAGHVFDPTDTFLIPVSDPTELTARIPDSLAPAGSLSSASGDWAALQQDVLRGLLGLSHRLPISQRTLQRLYTPSSPSGLFGFGTAFTSVDGVPVEFFIGSTGTFFAVNALVPDLDVGTFLAVNAQAGVQGTETIDIGEALFSLAQLGRAGLSAPQTADQAVVFSGVESVCGGSAGTDSPLVALLGRAPREDVLAIAEAIAPNDARIAPRVALAPMEHAARLIRAQIRTPIEDGQWRFSVVRSDVDDAAPLPGGVPNAPISSQASLLIAEARLGADITALGALGFGEAAAQSVDARLSASAETPFLAASLSWRPATGLFAEVMALVGAADIATRRVIATESIDLGAASGERDGRIWIVDADVGYRVGLEGGASLAPFVGVRRQSLALDAFDETGSPAALAIAEQDYAQTLAHFGVEAQYPFDLGSQVSLTPRAQLLYRRSLDRSGEEVRARFLEGGDLMTFAASPEDSDWYEYDVSLDARYDGLSFSVGAVGTLGRDGADNVGWQARLSARF